MTNITNFRHPTIVNAQDDFDQINSSVFFVFPVFETNTCHYMDLHVWKYVAFAHDNRVYIVDNTIHIDGHDKMFVYRKSVIEKNNGKFNGWDIDVICWVVGAPIIDVAHLYTPNHRYMYSLYPFNQAYRNKVNTYIPLTKHIELAHNVFNMFVKNKIGKSNPTFKKTYEYVYLKHKLLQRIDYAGVYIDVSNFWWEARLSKNQDILSSGLYHGMYNVFTTTGRPSNSYNSINLLALNKNDGSRDGIISRRHKLVEFDFDGSHLRILGNLTGRPFNTELAAHKQLAQIYFNKTDISDDEYQKAKTITFRNLYNVSDKTDIEFFKGVNALKHALWQTVQETGGYLSPITNCFYMLDKELEPNIVLNYFIQNIESEIMTKCIVDIMKKLNGSRSAVILYTYDSILLDVHENDTQLIEEIHNTLNQNYKVHYKIGTTYDNIK